MPRNPYDYYITPEEYEIAAKNGISPALGYDACCYHTSYDSERDWFDDKRKTI